MKKLLMSIAMVSFLGCSGSVSSPSHNGSSSEAVNLGSANNYTLLAKTEITNVPTSSITGDVGLSPAAASYISGFALSKVGIDWNSAQVTGHVFAANNDPPTPINLTTAVSDMQTAYTDAAGRADPTSLNLMGGSLGGLTLKPGLYKYTTSVTIPTDVTLEGSSNDTWIFQISGNLTESGAKRIILSGGAQAKNVFWQVAGSVALGVSSHFEGVILCKTSVALNQGVTLNGKIFAQSAITLNQVTIVAP